MPKITFGMLPMVAAALCNPLTAQSQVKISGPTADLRLSGTWALDSAHSDLISPKLQKALATFPEVADPSQTGGVIVKNYPGQTGSVRIADLLQLRASPAQVNAEKGARGMFVNELRPLEMRIGVHSDTTSTWVNDSQTIAWVTDKKDRSIPLAGGVGLDLVAFWKDGVLQSKVITPLKTEWRRDLKLLPDGVTLEATTQILIGSQKYKLTTLYHKESEK